MWFDGVVLRLVTILSMLYACAYLGDLEKEGK